MDEFKQPNVPGIKIGGVLDTYTRKQADERFQSTLSKEQLDNIADVPNKASKKELEDVRKKLNDDKQDKLTQKQIAVLSDIDNLGLMVKEELDGAVEEINKKTGQSLEEVNKKAEKALEDAQKSIEEIEQKAAESLATIPEDYTKLNDYIEEAHAALGMTRFSGITWRDGYWRIFHSNGVLSEMSETAASRLLLSNPIKVSKGDVVTVASRVGTNYSVLATTDENETSYTSVIEGQNGNINVSYSYEIIEDCYIVVSCAPSGIDGFSINIRPTKSKEMEDIKKNVDVLSKNIEDNTNTITDIHNALGITQFKDILWRDGYHGIGSNGKFNTFAETASTLYKLSEPIKVNMGDIITLTSRTNTGYAVLSTTDDPESTTYTPILLGTGSLETYEYTVETECYMAVCCVFDKTTQNVVDGFSLDIKPTKSKEITDMNNTLKSLIAPNFYGAKNGGNLTSSANGRKGTTTVEMLIKNEREETGWFYGASNTLTTTGVYYGTGGNLNISLNVGNYECAQIQPYTKGTISHIVIVYDDDEKSKTAYYNGVFVGKEVNEACATQTLQDKMLDGVVVYQKRIWNRVLNADEVSKLYNHGFPTKFILPESISNGLISNLSCQGITETGWLDTASGQEIAFDEGAELYSVDEFSEYKQIKKLNEDMAQEQSVIKQNVYPEFEVKTVSRGAHDCTFINGDLVSFNKPSDGYAVYINGETLVKEKSVNISFTDNDYMGTPRELEMKSCDYKYGKLLVGNGRAIKHGETEYTQQGARLYVFYNADTWKAMTGQITLDNCGDYDVIDVSGLGNKIYGFWGQFDDCVFVSCNLFNDIYLIQLGKGAVNLGQGTYTEGVSEDRYNGSFMVINHWHQDGALGDWAGHGGQYYKGHLYIATNDLSLCTVYKCILNHNGKLEFEALNFDVKDTTDTNYLKYRYIDGICIKDDILYAQPLYEGKGTDSKAMIVAKI